MYIIWILLAFMALYIFRAARGPSIWDRLLGMSLVSSKLILVVVVYASITETSYFLDFAIVYALLGFIGIIFAALFLLDRLRGGKK